MKNRREFLHLSSLGFLSPLIKPIGEANKYRVQTNTGIVKQPEDGETYFVRENTPITILISRKTDSVESVSLCYEEIQPGGRIPVHKHLHEDEYFQFHKGSGTINIDGREYPVKPGTSGFVPRNTWHSINNTNTELLTFSFGYAPAGFEDFFRQIGTPKGTPFKAKTSQEITLIAEKYGMVYK